MGRTQAAPAPATLAASAVRTLAENTLPLFDSAAFRSLSAHDVAKVLQLAADITAAAPEAVAPAEAHTEASDASRPAAGTEMPAGAAKEIIKTYAPVGNAHSADAPYARDLQAVRWTAAAKLTEAETALSHPHAERLADWDAPPSDLLRLAQDLYATGSYDNLIRSGLLSQSLLSNLRPPVLVIKTSAPREGTARVDRRTALGKRLRQSLPPRLRTPLLLALAVACAVLIIFLLIYRPLR